MYLELADGRKLKNASPEQIEQELKSLVGGLGESFAILGPTSKDLTYIQVAGSAKEGFLLEFQEGSLERHYRCVNTDLTLDKIIQAFQLYAEGNSRWRTDYIWIKESLAEDTGSMITQDQVVYIDQLSGIQPGDILAVAASQIRLLTNYYNTVLAQATMSFRWALAAAVVGSCFFLGAIFFLIATNNASPLSQNITIISVIGGTIVEVIAGINFFLYGKTTAQLAHFHERLDRTQRFLLANSICEMLGDEEKNKSRAELVRVMATFELNRGEPK